jgi:hypothetical protein
MKYVVYINEANYDSELKEIKKQMKDYMEPGDKVIYLRTQMSTHITVLASAS